MKHKPLFSLAVALVLLVTSGASCPGVLRQVGTPIPTVLPQVATLDQVIAAVNDNTARARNGTATQATLSVPGAPPLRADLAFEQSRRFRLTGGTGFGKELDVGSNDELFWIWVKRNQPHATLFCRHDMYPQSNARQIMPVESDWLLEALGLAQFRPQDQHTGPTPVSAGRLEIRSLRQTPSGEMTKITVVDASRALVLEQHLYDTRGQRVATALTTNHVRDGISGANMPRQIDLHLPSAQLQMRIDVVNWQLNALGPQHAGIWTKPENPEYPNVDLADPSIQFNLPPVQAAVPAVQPPQQAPRVSGRFRERMQRFGRRMN